MQPVRRDLSFPIDKKNILDWHPAGRQVGLFMNCMSILFPVGERFFISSVRNYQDDIRDPKLRKAVRAFIGQEAMHGREHEIYNAALQEAGIPAEKMEAEVKGLLDFFRKHTPRSVQLSRDRRAGAFHRDPCQPSAVGCARRGGVEGPGDVGHVALACPRGNRAQGGGL